LHLTWVIAPSQIYTTSNSVSEYPDRKSTRLNSSHVRISYAVFCLKKKIRTARKVRIVTDHLWFVLLTAWSRAVNYRFFFNDLAATEVYPISPHNALQI